MLKSDLLIYRYSGNTIVPKKLPLLAINIDLAIEIINCFHQHIGKTQAQLDTALQEIEGDRPDYRLQRGLVHILRNSFCTFEIVSPISPSLLREKVFASAASIPNVPENRNKTIETIAFDLSKELEKDVLPHHILQGLYADLQENRILTEFDEPTPETLIHRYNLSQVQGLFYRASHLIIHAHRNDPGEYKLLFRYLKLFQLISYIEGDADTGFTITIDGPTSLFKASTRYGLALAKMIPALLHVNKWKLEAQLKLKDAYSKKEKLLSYHLDDGCGLVSHYQNDATYDSMLERSFATRWEKLKTEWKLEREVDLIPLPGSVMIPDFRLVHPDGRSFLLEIIGFWHPQYLQKKFYQVSKSENTDLILAVSERLNLEKAGVNFNQLPNHLIWFKNKLSPNDVLKILDSTNN